MRSFRGRQFDSNHLPAWYWRGKQNVRSHTIRRLLMRRATLFAESTPSRVGTIRAGCRGKQAATSATTAGPQCPCGHGAAGAAFAQAIGWRCCCYCRCRLFVRVPLELFAAALVSNFRSNFDDKSSKSSAVRAIE